MREQVFEKTRGRVRSCVWLHLRSLASDHVGLRIAPFRFAYVLISSSGKLALLGTKVPSFHPGTHETPTVVYSIILIYFFLHRRSFVQPTPILSRCSVSCDRRISP